LRAYKASSCLLLLANNFQPVQGLEVIDNPTELPTEQYVVAQLNDGSRRIFEKLFMQLRKRAVSKEPDFDAFQAQLAKSIASEPADLREAVASIPDDGIFNIALLKGTAGAYTVPQGVKPILSPKDAARLRAAVGSLESDIGLCLTRE